MRPSLTFRRARWRTAAVCREVGIDRIRRRRTRGATRRSYRTRGGRAVAEGGPKRRRGDDRAMEARAEFVHRSLRGVRRAGPAGVRKRMRSRRGGVVRGELDAVRRREARCLRAVLRDLLGVVHAALHEVQGCLNVVFGR